LFEDDIAKIAEDVYSYLQMVGKKIRKGEVKTEKFIITKVRESMLSLT
jgi:DNA polymerase elongation subunit (family B)